MHRSTHALGAISVLATLLIVLLLVIAWLDPELARLILDDGKGK